MRLALALACTALTLGLAACGDDDDSSEEATPAATTTDTTTPASGTSDAADFPAEPCPGADSPPNIVNVTSYGTDCGAVEDAMAKLGSAEEEFRLGDFECAQLEGSSLGGTWECRGEASYFTFEFGD
jgi:hypothetical protein